MRPLLAALLFVPAVGLAQTASLAITVSGTGTSGTLAYNASNCTTPVVGTWTVTNLSPSPCTALSIWTTAFTCGTNVAPNNTYTPPDALVTSIPSGTLTSGTTKGTFTFPFNALPGFSSGDGGVPCGSASDFTNTLCAAVQLLDNTGACAGITVTGTPVITLRYDNIPPIPPAVTVSPLDSQLSVRLAPGDSTDTISNYQVQYAPDAGAGVPPTYRPATSGNIPANNPSVTISNLTNGTDYFIVALAIDEATNQSPYSTPVVATPVVTLGFYANYLDAGGTQGGCGDAAGGGPSALAFATVLLLFVARRRG
jgi:hypothetical protein